MTRRVLRSRWCTKALLFSAASAISGWTHRYVRISSGRQLLASSHPKHC